MDAISRRELVVAAAAVGVCACAAGCRSGGVGDRGIDPDAAGNRVRDPATAEALQPGPVDVGTAGDYPRDGAYDRFVKSDRLIIVRQGGQLYALSAVCPHRACNVRPVGGDLRCPCHGARFDLDGVRSRGPGTGDLPRYAIARDAAGRVIVGKSRKVRRDDPAGVIAVL